MANKVKGIPDNSSCIIPRLVCKDGAAEIEFCLATFGAVELNKRFGPVIFVFVEDVDKTIERAIENGGTVIVQPQNQFWGDRIAWIMDPAGHVWTIATRIEETTAKERSDRWDAIPKE